MEDERILELYFARDEAAISESRKKYGNYCRHVALRILNDREDAEEVENDAYLKAWNSIPPARPLPLAPYLGMLCRRIAIDRLKAKTRFKRGKGEYALTLGELSECVPDRRERDDPVDRIALRDALNAFLAELPEDTRVIFMRRYWWVCTVSEIAAECDMSESAVKMQLLRTREKLKEYLKKEGFNI